MATTARGAAAWPTGTVTFLFTDIEGSTALWQHHPAEMEGALARHDALLRTAIESAHGHLESALEMARDLGLAHFECFLLVNLASR